MSINLIRFLANQKKKAQRYHTDELRYRGVTYKEIGWWCRAGSTPAPVIGIVPVRGYHFACLDSRRDDKQYN